MDSGWLWTFLIAATLGGAGYWGSRHALRQAPGLPRALAAAVLAWAWLTIGIQSLGISGFLSRGPLLAWTCGGLVLAGGVRMARPRRDAEKAATAEGWDAAATIAVGLTLWVCLIFGVPSLLLPVKVVSDGPIYHLYFAARWWKEASLSLIASPFGESAATYFPANGDLWFTGLMVAWGGDRLARVGQAPFLLLASATAYGLARRLGTGASAAILAVCWFVTCAPVVLFSFEANVDTIFVAGYLLSCYFLLRYALGDDGLASLGLAGLAAGAAWGTKPTGIVFVPVLLAGGAALIVARKATTHRKLGELATLGASSLVMTGFWFGRSWWLTGNPFYPLHLEVFGVVVLRGWFPTSAMRWSQFYIPREQWAALVDTLLGVFDPRLVPVWLAALGGAWAVGGGSKTIRERWVWAAGALALGNVALYWLVIPYRTQQRFMIQAVALAAVPLGRLFDRGRAWRWLGLGLLAVHLLTAQIWPFGKPISVAWFLPEIPNALRDLQTPDALIRLPIDAATGQTSVGGASKPAAARVPSPTGAGTEPRRVLSWSILIYHAGKLAFGLGSLGAAWLWSRWTRQRRWGPLVMAAVATIALVATAAAGLEFGVGGSAIVRPTERVFPYFREYNEAWLALDRATRHHPSRIAYAGTNLPYYLMGKDLRNDVRYVNVDDHPGWLMHDYHLSARERGDPVLWNTPRPGWDRIHPDLAAWLENLRNAGIEFLVVARANPVDGPFNIADPEQFPIERVWAEALPGLFQPLYGVDPPDPEMRIYRFLPEKISTDRVAGRH